MAFWQRLSLWHQTALDFVFPAECQHCRGFLGDARVEVFCGACWRQIAPLGDPVCPHCGKPIAIRADHAPPATGRRCRQCRVRPLDVDAVLTATSYAGMGKAAIQHFKFHQITALGRPLAQLIVQRLPEDFDPRAYQAILPVPLHVGRRRQRGYNQAEILARELSRSLRIPCRPHALRRVRHTHQQALVTGRQARRANVRNAFQVQTPAAVAGKTLLLVDDVVTTGATVSECARMLKKAGALAVTALAVARTRH